MLIMPILSSRSTSQGLDAFTILPDAIKAELSQRGEVYNRVATASTYMQYEPGCFMPVARGGGRAPSRARGGGRIMVDLRGAWTRGVHCARSEGVAR
jgi:hypothetical protein